MKLSDHFQLSEFIVSQSAERLGIDNTPSDTIIEHLHLLCAQILEPARVALGPLHISSGYRSPTLNAAIGGSKSSAHMQGYAADVIPLKITKMVFAKWVEENCKFDQIILEYGIKTEPAWIHVSADPRNRKQVLQILKGTPYQHIEI